MTSERKMKRENKEWGRMTEEAQWRREEVGFKHERKGTVDDDGEKGVDYLDGAKVDVKERR